MHLRTPSRSTTSRRALSPIFLTAVSLAVPVVLAISLSSGCGGDTPKPVTPPPSGSGDAETTVAPLVPPVTAPKDGGGAHDAGGWPTVAVVTDAAPDGPAPACWKGFAPTGNPDTDVHDLAKRCAEGMTVVGTVFKHTFKTGEVKTIPIPVPPGCYRVIAVGGNGVKNVDLALKDGAGKVVAADMTPNDVFPMIHPNKEFCTESFQLLNFNIIVDKGAGEVAGGVWKR